LRGRLLVYFRENSQQMLADAVEHCEIVESAAEVKFSGAKHYALAMRDNGLKTGVQQVLGRPVRITFQPVEGADSAPSASSQANVDEEAARRALSNSEVQRFQATFPESQVRAVRNLQE
jgi:hypothetical protein